MHQHETKRKSSHHPHDGFNESADIPLGGHYYDLSLGKRQPDELYRLSDDRECVRNLAHDLAFKDILDDLRYRMMGLLKEEGDPRALGQSEIFDAYEYQGNRAKGYDSWLREQETTKLSELKKKLEEDAAKPKPKRKNKALPQ